MKHKLLLSVFIPLLLCSCGMNTIMPTTSSNEMPSTTAPTPQIEVEVKSDSEIQKVIDEQKQNGFRETTPNFGKLMKQYAKQEVGNYPTYISSFQFPPNIRILTRYGEECYSQYQITDTGNLYEMHYPLTNEETNIGVDAVVTETYYRFDDDAYEFLNVKVLEPEQEKTEIFHIPLGDDDVYFGVDKPDNALHYRVSQLQQVQIIFEEYLGEQVMDGITYDTISCKMNFKNSIPFPLLEEENVTATFWFTKEGKFKKIDFYSKERPIRGFIEETALITESEVQEKAMGMAQEKSSQELMNTMLTQIGLYSDHIVNEILNHGIEKT